MRVVVLDRKSGKNSLERWLWSKDLLEVTKFWLVILISWEPKKGERGEMKGGERMCRITNILSVCHIPLTVQI